MIHQTIANYITVLLLVGGAVIFGYSGKPAEMGLFIVACALALFFVNVERFKSFKGGGVSIEAKPDKGIDSASFSINEKKIIETVKAEIDKYLFSSSNQIDKNIIESILKEIDDRLEKLPQLIEKSEYVVVDTDGFSSKTQWRFPINEYHTIRGFLDDVYLALEGISPLSYNRQWVLFNQETGEPMKKLHLKGPVSLHEAGINAGMRLRVGIPQ
ncbi:hypothetical protein [Alteromonas macleodii]|uniref:hypothetical protein n=1 Tax=Alteromonas macleodii TaxID=28108 RepID=UPI000C784C35|nr:hypothetical protein [Alteromonas macleodii]AUI81464.1 hypothetical protein TE101_03770 [Alteromonas macleodii]